MNFEKSCGAVIYRNNNDNLEFLTIRHSSDGHWGFPKGHVEKGESEEETAIREIYEETGLQVKLVDGFRIIDGYSPTKGVIKEVIFFLAKVEEEAVHIQLEEVKEYRWASFAKSKEILTYESSKRVLEQAYEFILD